MLLNCGLARLPHERRCGYTRGEGWLSVGRLRRGSSRACGGLLLRWVSSPTVMEGSVADRSISPEAHR